MTKWRMILALVLTYMLFGVLLNSVGTVILQSIASFGVSKSGASILEAFKDLPIAVVSFLVAAFLPRLGFRRAMMLGTGAVAAGCLAMPLVPGFATAKLLFAITGASFALVKVSVYSAIGLVTRDAKGHASLTNAVEGLFMVGVLSGYWIFGAFISHDNPGDPVWLDVYWLLSAIAATVLLLLATSSLDESAAQIDRGSPARDFAAMVSLLLQPLVIIFVISAFLYVLIEQAIGTWLPTFNNQILHLPAAMSVQAASLFAAALAIGRLVSSIVLARVSWYPVVNTCIVAMAALVVGTLPLTHGVRIDPGVTWLSAPFAAFLLPLIGLFLAPIYPALNSTMLSALPKSDHAAMTGMLVVFSALGGTTGSLITGQVFDRFSGQTAFYLTLVPMAFLLGMLTLFRRSTVARAAPKVAA